MKITGRIIITAVLCFFIYPMLFIAAEFLMLNFAGNVIPYEFLGYILVGITIIICTSVLLKKLKDLMEEIRKYRP